ncbi:MAG: phage protease [Planctomycetota bacterium]
MKFPALFASRLITATDDRPVPVEGATWIQISTAGEYFGHSGGPFELNREAFECIIRNFQAHPSFELDPVTGFGQADVIAFDFSHASEEPPAMVGVQGAPAQSWALDLEIRTDEKGDQLWALTRWLEPARSYVQQQKYKWTSVAVFPEAVDPKTGEDIGWYMSSIAFTNDPFIQGMTPIAARRAGLRLNMSPQWLFDAVKTILGLPTTSSLEEVQTALAPARAAAQPGAAPPVGVDVDELVLDLKSLLQLPLLADAESVFAEVDKLFGLIAAEPPAPVTQIPGDQTAPGTTTALAAGVSTHMKEWIIKLARRAGIDFDAGDLDDEVKSQMLAQRVVAATLLKLEGAETATKALGAIAKALGVNDPDAAVAALTEMLASVNEIKTAMPSLAAIMEGQITAQDEEEEEDVERVAAANGWGDDVKFLARTTRSGGVEFPKRDPQRQLTLSVFAKELQENAVVFTKKKSARDAWRKKYMGDDQRRLPEAPPYLGHNFTKPQENQPHSPVLRALKGGRGGAPVLGPPSHPDQPAGGSSINFDDIPGANLTAKCEYLVRKDAAEAGVTLTYDQLNSKAVMMAREIRPTLTAAR